MQQFMLGLSDTLKATWLWSAEKDKKENHTYRKQDSFLVKTH